MQSLVRRFDHAGRVVFGRTRGLRGLVLGPDRLVRAARGGPIVSVMELVGLLVAAGLLVYLLVALVKPEWFA